MSGVNCTICGEFLACDEDDCEAFDGEGVEGEDEYVIEPGFAHDICINAGAGLRRWLHFGAHDVDHEAPPRLPVDDLAHWLRHGGSLSETHSLMLLDEIGRLQVERDEAREEVRSLRQEMAADRHEANVVATRLRAERDEARARLDAMPNASPNEGPKPPTVRQIEINGAVAQAAVWHLVNKQPDAALCAAWAEIGSTTLLELAEAMDACEKWASRPDDGGDGPKTVITRVADRLAAAVYVAAHYDASGKVVVARHDAIKPNKAHAVYVAPADIRGED